jgi:hypothetical protein
VDTTNKFDKTGSLADDLQIIPVVKVRAAWRVSDAVLYHLEKTGELVPLRFGRRRYYSLNALRKFLESAQQAAPISVPWKTTPDHPNSTNPTDGETHER